eukprot:1149901-Pelagomonas_calceolata.AAC.4
MSFHNRQTGVSLLDLAFVLHSVSGNAFWRCSCQSCGVPERVVVPRLNVARRLSLEEQRSSFTSLLHAHNTCRPSGQLLGKGRGGVRFPIAVVAMRSYVEVQQTTFMAAQMMHPHDLPGSVKVRKD